MWEAAAHAPAARMPAARMAAAHARAAMAVAAMAVAMAAAMKQWLLTQATAHATAAIPGGLPSHG